jgi:hypothetical protein
VLYNFILFLVSFNLHGILIEAKIKLSICCQLRKLHPKHMVRLIVYLQMCVSDISCTSSVFLMGELSVERHQNRLERPPPRRSPPSAHQESAPRLQVGLSDTFLATARMWVN